MAATLPKPKPPRKRRKPRRQYVVIDFATEDTEAGNEAVEAWLREVAPK